MKAYEPNFDRNVHCLLGLPFDAMNMPGALQIVQMAVSSRKQCFISTPNLNFLIACLHDSQFRDSVIKSDLCVADGMPLIWMARLLQIPLPERVAGSGMFERLRADRGNAMKVYFFGGQKDAAESACQQLNSSHSSMHCVGSDSPGFGSIEDMSSPEIIDSINASRADFLVVALGAKKGNAWIEHNLPRLSVPVVCHLGAVVNFVAGTVSRAPTWMQRVGLEWLWRIKEEPQLWRRYFFDGVAFSSVMLCRVLPYAWFLLRHRPLPGEVASAGVVANVQAGLVVLKLRGAWTSANIELLRTELKLAVRDRVDIKLDMADVNYVDSSFIGLMLLLYGYQQRVGKRLDVASVENSVSGIFKFNCAQFLLD